MSSAIQHDRFPQRSEVPPAKAGSGIWQRLQDQKEMVSNELLMEGPLLHGEVFGLQDRDLSDESSSAVEWQYRAQLEARLRNISEAQDRLIDGTYGRCTECGEQIEALRLMADPAVALCLWCRTFADDEMKPHSL